jgi:hypothetical protein
MSRALSLALFGVWIFSLAGCGSSCTTASTGTSTSTSSSSSSSTNTCTTTTATVTINLTPNATTIVALGSTLQFTADVSGYSNISLTWQVNGLDGGNSTVGTISSSGLYKPPATVPNPSQVTVTAVSNANTTDTASVGIIITSGVTMSVSPSTADLLPGKTQQFTATVVGNSNTAVTWAVAGLSGGNSTVGTISSQGVYTAPATLTSAPQSVAVTATAAVDATKSASGTVTLHNNLSVSIAPGIASVQTFGQQQFTATVAGDNNASFSWQVNGVSGGNSAYGTITGGLYTAPNHVPTNPLTSGVNLASGGRKAAPVTITAIYQADSYFSASSVVAVTSANQKVQNLPIALGVSGGNAGDSGSTKCCGGTLGALVSRGGQNYILSNSHVLARTDSGVIGDLIIQPGLPGSSCSTTSTNQVATLSQFVDLESLPTGGPIDAALALISSGKVDLTGTVLELGGTTNNSQPTDGAPHAGSGVAPSLYEADGITPLKVAKSGSATGLTCSSISAINVTASVTYQKGCDGAQFQQTYTDLVVIGGADFSASGDSGALIVTQDNADPVALLFASSDTDSLGSPVADVLAALADPGTGEKPVFVGSANVHPVAACTLPGASASTTSAAQTQYVASSKNLQNAESVLSARGATLLAYPGVESVGVDKSMDASGEAAIVLFVSSEVGKNSLPQSVDGIRTRIASASINSSTVAGGSGVKSPSVAEMARAKAGHALAVTQMMKLAGVQAVGITRSSDNPGEAALFVSVIRGVEHERIPPVVGGLRTVVRESSAIRSSFGDTPRQRACSGFSHGTN